jgi:hypothetical protein
MIQRHETEALRHDTESIFENDKFALDCLVM